MNDVTWSCTCGTLQFSLTPGDGARLKCYCDDCQAFANALGAANQLDAAGGSDLYQTAPHNIRITQGADQLAALKLSSKGPLRWYAACCNAPLANTTATRNVPFSSIVVAGLKTPDALGPVTALVNRKFASQRVDALGSIGKLMRGAAVRALKARLTGRWKSTPFFDDAGAPAGPVRQLDETERRAHTPTAG